MPNIKLLPLSITEWYQEKLGKSIFLLEQEHLQEFLPKAFGNYYLQYYNNEQIWLDVHPFTQKIFILPEPPDQEKISIQADLSALPLPNDTIDSIVMPHILEFDKNPLAILHEAWRILTPEGHLIILGFNKTSLWGIKNLFTFNNRFPWDKHYCSFSKVKDYLYEMNAEIITSTSFCFTPPNEKDTHHKQQNWHDMFFRFLFPNNGGIYLIIAKKRVVPITPIKSAWHLTNVLLGKNYAEEPTVGNISHDQTR